MAAKEEEKEMEVGKDLAAGKEEVMGEEKEEGEVKEEVKEEEEGGWRGATRAFDCIARTRRTGGVARVFRLKRSRSRKHILCAVVAAVPVHEEMSWLNAEAE